MKTYTSLLNKTYRLIVITLAFGFCSTNLFAQAINATTYPLVKSDAVALEDMTGASVAQAGNIDDAPGGLQPIGFDFWFVGVRYTQFSASPDGFIRLGGTAAVAQFSNDLASTTNYPIIAPFWDDSWGGTDGGVVYKVIGSVPNRKLAIEWRTTNPRAGGVLSNLFYQLWLSESTGAIDFVFGSGATAGPSGGYSMGFAASAAGTTPIATMTVNSTWTASTIAYVASAPNNTNNTGIASGSRASFTPLIPADPSGLTFSSVTPSGMTLNWTDNAANEVGYVIYRSIDGVNYTFINQVAANSSSFVATGLSPSTNYLWKVYAVTEGALSINPVSGSQTTNPCSGTAGLIAVGPSGPYPGYAASYPTLSGSGGALAAVLSGASSATIELQPDYVSTSETFPITFSFSSCLAGVNSLTIRPAASVVSALSITSANTTATIDFNGANFVTIDGRPGGAGASRLLNIINTATAGVAVRLINDASNNTIKFCDVQGQNTTAAVNPASTNAGVIYFSTTTGLNGNDNNTVSNCNIHGTATGTPAQGVVSNGTTTTAATNNDNNVISDNNIFDFFLATGATAGINLSPGNTGWTISNNSLYQSVSRTYTSGATHRGMWITPNTGTLSDRANNFNITGNFIGGTVANAGGTPYTILGSTTNVFLGMDISVGLGTATSIQSNTIQNIAFTTTSTANPNFAAISVANGNVNIGTVTGNTIGSGTGTGSITINQTTSSGGTVYGIRLSGGTSTTLVANNNTVGSFTINGSTTTISDNFIGIGSIGGTTTFVTVNGNTVGSTTTANSINQTSTGAVSVAMTGIAVTTGPTGNPVSVSNNTVANLTSNCLSTGLMKGITATLGVVTMNGNTVRNLSTSSTATGSGNSSAIVGINESSSTTGSTVSGNMIFGLSITSSTITTQQITGLFWQASGTATFGTISKNLIYNMGTTAANTSATLTGIDCGGSGVGTFINNMVRMGYDASGNPISTAVKMRGITKGATTGNIWHNSVFVGGSGVGTTTGNNTFALNLSTINATDDVRDNIIVNLRQNSTTGSVHAAVGVANLTTGFNLNFNDYQYAAANGNVFAFNIATSASISAYTGVTGWVATDANSFAFDPRFLSPTASTPDLHINSGILTVIEGQGTLIASVTDDFDGQTRATLTPTDIGADAGNFVGCAGVVTVAVTPTSANYCSPSAGSVTLSSVNVHDSYSWSPGGATTPSITVTPTSTTTYTLIGSNASGCRAGASATITVLPGVGNITATSSLPTVCPGIPVDLFSSATSVSTATSLSENFDAAVAPALPSGWTTSNTINPDGIFWVTANTGSFSAPNSAFINDPGAVSDKVLVSPAISISASATQAQLTFRNSYATESTFDGGILEISINGGPFTGIITAGGTFVTGGYNATISASSTSPIAGQSAWTGSSGGFVITTVNLPASVIGQSIVLRFRMTSDASVSSTGWRIDDVQLALSIPLAVSFNWTSSPADAQFPASGQNQTGIIVNNSPTVYTVTASNSFSCTATASVSVSVGSGGVLPVTVAANPASFCPGQTTTSITATVVGGGAPYNYVWSNGFSETTNSLTSTISGINAGGVYSVTVTDACPAVGNTSVNIIPYTLPTISVSPTSGLICSPGGSPVVLTASGADAFGQGTYVPSPTTGLTPLTFNSASANPSATTTYTIVGTDGNGCSGTTSVTVLVSPAVSMNSVTATPPIACSGSGNVSLNANASLVLSSGAYCASSHSSGSCGFNDNISNVTLNTLSNPSGCTAAPGYVDYTLGGPTTTLSAGTSYTISISFGSDGSQFFAAWIDYNQDGTFDPVAEFLGGNTVNAGSSGTATASFTVPAGALNGPTRLRVVGGNDSQVLSTQSCGASSSSFGETEDYTVSISGGVPAPSVSNFSWTADASPDFLNGTQNNNPATASNMTAQRIYSVVASSSAGCSASGSVTVAIATPLTVSAGATLTTTCAGKPTQISATITGGGSPLGISWVSSNGSDPNPVSTSASFSASPTLTTTYTVTVTDPCGPSQTASVTINVNPNPVVSVTPTTGLICTPLGAPIHIAASGAGTGGSYSWDNTLGLLFTQLDNSEADANPSATTIYTVTATDINSCTASANTVITVAPQPVITSVTATPSPVCQVQLPAQLLVSGTGLLATSQTFSNTSNIIINDATTATPFPSTIAVSGLIGTPSVQSVTVTGWSHTFPSDCEILLVAPNGGAILLFGRAADGTDVVNGTVTFSDAASGFVVAPLVSGTYKPTNGVTGTGSLLTPAPASPYSLLLSSLNGSNMNGTWSLYVDDRAGADVGNITGGWSITFSGVATTTYTWTSTPGGALSATNIPNPTASPSPGSYDYFINLSNSGCTTSSSVHLDALSNPATPTVVPGFRCGPGVVHLSASGTATLEWYDAPYPGGALVNTGNTYDPNLTATTTFYVQSNDGSPCPSPRVAVVATVKPPAPVINLTNSNPVICNPGTAPNSSLLSANVSNASAELTTFTSSGAITIPAGAPSTTSGNASPYPSVISVSGLSGVAALQSVQLTGLTHTFSGDIDMVLVSPTGVPVELMSDAGGGSGLVNANFTIQDGSPTMPSSSLTSGTYSPSADGSADNFPAPGPGSLNPTNPTLASFTGDPNGTWSLYIVDDAGGDVGTLASWSLNFADGTVFTYNWTVNAAPLISGSLIGNTPVSQTVNPVASATPYTYQVTFTNQTTGCSSSATTSVQVNKAPQIVSLQSATLNGGAVTTIPAPPTFLNIPVFTAATTCDKVVNYNVAITGFPDPAEAVGGITYSFSGATTGSGDGTGTGSTFGRAIPNGTTFITVNATNVCGSLSKQFRVTVTDNVAPIITPIQVSPTNTNGGNCSSLVQVTQPSQGNGMFDNCPNANLVWVSRSDGRPQFDPYFAGTTTVTWEATDASGNTSTATQNVVVNNIKPVITSLTAASGNVIFTGQSTTFTAVFTDEDGGGPHTVKFYRDKNDATPADIQTLAAVCYNSCNGISTYTVTSASILFSTSEVVEPKVEVLDGCSMAADQVPGTSTFQYLAVAVAGTQFTTAGGHFTLQPGTYPSSYAGLGVNIGNVVKPGNGNNYKGQLEMNVHLTNNSDWRVHTDNGTNTDITWDYLVVSGCTLATFKGACRVNGQTGYKVLVQQADKNANTATSNFIRVKVTTNGGVLIFDTQPGLTEALTSGNGGAAAIVTALDGGSVTVHPNNGCVARIDDKTADGLMQNIPNPFNGNTEIRFSVPEDGNYTLKVYNYLGQEVTTLFNGDATAGSLYSVTFDGSNLDAGIYTYTLRSANVSETRRMNLIK